MTDKKLYDKVSENAYIDLYKTWDKTVDEVYDLYINLISKNHKKC